MTIRVQVIPRVGTEVKFSFTEIPTLVHRAGPAYQQVGAMLERLTPAEREAVLLNLCQKYGQRR